MDLLQIVHYLHTFILLSFCFYTIVLHNKFHNQISTLFVELYLYNDFNLKLY
jgi:hypothetical protein